MYPGDDYPIRVRLLINECRELRQRLAQRVAESRELRARVARCCQRSRAPRTDGAKRRSFGGGGSER